MKHKLVFALALIVLGWTAFAVIPAEAVTAAGPYYAVPSWDQTYSASTRFVVLSNMSNAAVLDRETGLVWEQSPSTSTLSWDTAVGYCNGLTKGGRLGWRLPTIQELASLVDPTQSDPALPSGNPFSNVSSVFSYVYWSASTAPSAGSTSIVWYVNFGPGSVSTVGNDYSNGLVWCVRGGHGVDLQ